MLSSSYKEMHVGQISGSRARVISQQVIQDFADVSEDRHPLHLDEQYASSHQFGQRIAHGALVISAFLGAVELDPEYLVAFYGIDRLRFVNPTFSGDTIHAETEVLSIDAKGTGESAVITYAVTVLNQRDEAVMAGQFKLLAR